MSIMDANPSSRPDAVWPDGFRERAQAIADRQRAGTLGRLAVAAQTVAQPVDMAAGMQRVLELGAEFALDAIAQTLTDDAAPAWVLARIAEVRGQVIAHARTLLFEVPETPERRAPVQGELGRNAPPKGTIPWSVHLRIYERYVADGGGRQSAERIAERGGFGYAEAQRLLAGVRFGQPAHDLPPLEGWEPL